MSRFERSKGLSVPKSRRKRHSLVQSKQHHVFDFQNEEEEAKMQYSNPTFTFLFTVHAKSRTQIAVFLPVFVKTSPTSFAKCCSASRIGFTNHFSPAPAGVQTFVFCPEASNKSFFREKQLHHDHKKFPRSSFDDVWCLMRSAKCFF